MMRHIAVLLLLGLCCASCGPQTEDFTGAYEGKLERKETRDALTFMLEFEPYQVFIAPGATQEIQIQLREECAVEAQMQDDGAFEILGQRCLRELEGSSLDAVVNGSGTVSEDGTLTLDFELTGTGRLNTETYDYSSTESFTGVLQ